MMLSCRLRWYALATSRLLRRHWQALTLSILLLLPAMPVFAQTRILGAPVLAALAPSHGMQWRFVWVHMLEAVGMLWVLAQRGAITGGAFASFLDSLPTSHGRRRAVDIAVVLVASTPLFLPVLAAAVALAFLPQKATNYLFVLDLLLITLGWQLTALSRSARNAVPLVAANVILVVALQAGDTIRPALLVIPLLLAAFAIAYRPATSASRSGWRGALSRRAMGCVHANVEQRLSPVTRLQIGIVWDRAAGVFARFLVMGSVAASTCFLLGLWNFDARAIPLTLISQAVIALIAATTYRDLRAAHLRAGQFMRSLPVAAVTQPRADMLTVAALALPFACIAPLLLVAHGVLPLWSAAALLCSGAPLLILLYLPQRYAPRQSVLLGTMLAAIWVAVVWPLFT
ncbi:MAG TPA: DUF6136 family protein [Paraburkholderia sp.]|uniref:DUF6136 family protein n=1 Tax=Paraburkholderia sp. TaxID=1926495 RepID=UPI002B4A7A1C|nr:DUF6136 family protein [Paraburkholderia sp.]HKR39645.1 DUF6136 family protein [Paraburkholderia sp.]